MRSKEVARFGRHGVLLVLHGAAALAFFRPQRWPTNLPEWISMGMQLYLPAAAAYFCWLVLKERRRARDLSGPLSRP
jgi:hypothetical protein